MSREPIDLDSFTETEYEALSGVLCITYHRDNLFIPSGRDFLRVWKEYAHLRISMYRPLEDMPLHINDESDVVRIIALWRLKIGR
jgi:hypothetical protein